MSRRPAFWRRWLARHLLDMSEPVVRVGRRCGRFAADSDGAGIAEWLALGIARLALRVMVMVRRGVRVLVP